MGESLKDQLLALGLAKPDKAPKQRKRTRSGSTKPRSGKAGQGQAPGADMSLDAAWRMRAQDEKRSAAEKKRRKQEEDRLRRQVNARIESLVDAHALNDKAAELKRNFLYKGRIRSVLVTPEQLKALNAGELGLVFLRGNYFVVSPEVAQQARDISPDHVPDLGVDDQDPAEEEFPVPDDLTW